MISTEHTWLYCCLLRDEEFRSNQKRVQRCCSSAEEDSMALNVWYAGHAVHASELIAHISHDRDSS
jgi:hypothetical protein